MYIQSCKNDDADFTLCKNFTQTSDLLAAVVSVLSKVSRAAVENGAEGGRGESFTFCFGKHNGPQFFIYLSLKKFRCCNLHMQYNVQISLSLLGFNNLLL